MSCHGLSLHSLALINHHCMIATPLSTTNLPIDRVDIFFPSPYADNNPATSSANRSCIGEVGCRLLIHRYSSAAYSHSSSLVSISGVPLSTWISTLDLRKEGHKKK
ncbi:uncharacterized protein LDX57_001786 [Aspergillus melleus]|uniref:uncharacterized protein n=1 Tax=Aspergillus melleus TaxID=138277 RepID=UPI001E8E8CB7|nr:uncharacterized protein LDX57_001786 [Aspergillus melleus]KAH8424031.1 hypothetical protein LDX57_001786 [Aspergillus melleus]